MTKFKALLIIRRARRAYKLLSKTPHIKLDYGLRLSREKFDQICKALKAEIKVNVGHGYMEGYFIYKGLRVYNLESVEG